MRAEANGERALVALARTARGPGEALLALPPLRRLLHRRALAAWRSSPQPLILCYGNINRSPFAAALANAAPSERRASSGGLYPKEGRPSPPATVAAAAARGIDLSGHRSRLTEPSELAHSPAVFAFDLENLARIAWRSPRTLPHLHLIGCLAAAGPALIEDPHGRGEAELALALDAIQAAMSGL